MNLYKVTLQGMHSSYGVSYVVAEDPTEAYKKVDNFLRDKGIGLGSERVLKTIELIAEQHQFSATGMILYI